LFTGSPSWSKPIQKVVLSGYARFRIQGRRDKIRCGHSLRATAATDALSHQAD
jgi:hypothetical protein